MGIFSKTNKNLLRSDKYFSTVVEDFVKNPTVDGYIDLCKVLQYRKFYVCYETRFFDKRLELELKRSGTLPLECFNDPTKLQSELVFLKVKVDNVQFEVVSIFTDPSKIDLNNRDVNINTIKEMTLSELYEKHFNDDKFSGLCINPCIEQIFITNGNIKLILENDFDKLKEKFLQLLENN